MVRNSKSDSRTARRGCYRTNGWQSTPHELHGKAAASRGFTVASARSTIGGRFTLRTEVRVAAAIRRRSTWSCLVRLATLSVVVCDLAACGVTEPLPPTAERFAPPAVYARWWAMTEACSGRSGDLASILWYSVPSPQFMHDGQEAVGLWESRSNQIVLAKMYIDRGDVVRHEMLHALLRTGSHPRAQFLGSCASIVHCQGACVKDAGPWHAPMNYVVLPPDSLVVTSRAELLPPEADGQRWLELYVSVRNPRERAVVVAAPGDPLTPPTFGYDLRGPSGGTSGGDVATDSSALFIQPFETKQRLFEFQVASDLTEDHVSPGNYLVRGGYALLWSAYEAVTVSP